MLVDYSYLMDRVAKGEKRKERTSRMCVCACLYSMCVQIQVWMSGRTDWLELISEVDVVCTARHLITCMHFYEYATRTLACTCRV